MTKQIVTIALLLFLLIGGGFWETDHVSRSFAELETQLEELIELTEREEITEADFRQVKENWYRIRENVEFFINHTDIIEFDYRMAECESCVKYREYQLIHAQLSVMKELSRHIPHMITPSLEHIL